MAQVLSIQTPRRGRHRLPRSRVRPVEAEHLVFPTANGEDRVSVRPAAAGGPWVWVQVRSIYGESMQNAEVFLNGNQLRSVVHLLAGAAHRLNQRAEAATTPSTDAYEDEVICRVAAAWDEAGPDRIELPEDY
jgi:hypothetical protein